MTDVRGSTLLSSVEKPGSEIHILSIDYKAAITSEILLLSWLAPGLLIFELLSPTLGKERRHSVLLKAVYSGTFQNGRG